MVEPKLYRQMATFNGMSVEKNESSTEMPSFNTLNTTCPARIPDNYNNEQQKQKQQQIKDEKLFDEKDTNNEVVVNEDNSSKTTNSQFTRENGIPGYESKSFVRNAQAMRSFRNDRYKTGLCQSFRRVGYCPLKDDCPYAHGQNELRMPPARNNRSFLPRQRPDISRQYIRKPGSSRNSCNTFARTGNCRFGTECRYSHNIETPATADVTQQRPMSNYAHEMTLPTLPPPPIPSEHLYNRPPPPYGNPMPNEYLIPQTSYYAVYPTQQPYNTVDMNQTMPAYVNPPFTYNNGVYYGNPMPNHVSGPVPLMSQPLERIYPQFY